MSNNYPPQDAYRRRLADMLDLTYELEGLLHIGVNSNSVPSRLNQLIVNKLNALIELADAPAEPEEPTPSTDEYNAEDAPAPTDITDADVETQDIASTEQFIGQFTGQFPEDETDPTDMTDITDPEIGTQYIASAEQFPEQFPEQTTEQLTEQSPDEGSDSTEPAPKEKGRLFSINDRFLFAREVFGGKLANFDTAIDEIITLDSYDEAEEYMISEWNLDPESSEGIRFLAVIAKLF